jgi:formate dehydrogenase major subunit
VHPAKTEGATKTTSICPFCGVGCGLLAHTVNGPLVSVEDDPEYPINQGILCSKGQAVLEVVTSPRRLKKVLYRARGSNRWEEKNLDWAIKEMAQRMKTTRDANFIPKSADGVPVNRIEALAGIGGMSMVTLESILSAKAYGRKPEMGALTSLGKGLSVTLLVYFALKVTDLYARGVTVWSFDWAHLLFYAEIFGTIGLPALLLFFPEIRNSKSGLLWCAGLSAFGVLLNRFNVSLTSNGGYRDFWYFPSTIEIILTVGLVAMAILIFDFGMSYLPVHSEEAHATVR